jgi:spermidine/putrescine transport system substrate-binding protein
MSVDGSRNSKGSSVATLIAARRFTRRTLLKSAAAAGSLAAMGPWIVRDARSASGEVNILIWSDEVPDPIIPNFTKATGIKVNTTPFSQNEEQINKLQATGGEGFDLCQPTRDRQPQFQELGITQALDTGKLKNFGNLLPAFQEATKLWEFDGLQWVPHVWGSEAISWRTDKTQLDYKNLSYGTMWEEQYKGGVQGRPHSLLLGIGLWLDHAGKLPSNRMLDSFKDEETFRKIYDELIKVAVEHKPWIRQFWDSADNTKSGLMENGVIIGQTWDGPPLSLKKEGKPVSYMAPQEGAIAWIDGWSLTSGAANVDQAYEWINFIHTPETAAAAAEGSGYNPVVKGADALLSPTAKKLFQEAYPEDALEKLWNRPPEPSWYAELRTQYAERYKSA